MTAVPEELISEAGFAAEHTLEWRLLPDEWSRVRESLRRVVDGLAANRLDELRGGLHQLGQLAPKRVTRLSLNSAAARPPPQQVRELAEIVNHLVHSLEPEGRDPSGDSVQH